MPQEYEEKPNDHSPRPGQPLLFDGFEEPVSHARHLSLFTSEHAAGAPRWRPPGHHP